eukprot:s149_g17.t1
MAMFNGKIHYFYGHFSKLLVYQRVKHHQNTFTDRPWVAKCSQRPQQSYTAKGLDTSLGHAVEVHHRHRGGCSRRDGWKELRPAKVVMMWCSWCSLLGPLLAFGQLTPAPVEFSEGRMTDQTKDDFAALFDENFMQKMVDCQQLAGDTCDVTGMAEYMVQVGQRMQSLVNNCKTDCTHPPQVFAAYLCHL